MIVRTIAFAELVALLLAAGAFFTMAQVSGDRAAVLVGPHSKHHYPNPSPTPTGTSTPKTTPTGLSLSELMPTPTRAAAPTGPSLSALASGSSNSTLSASGFNQLVISASWAEIEPNEGSYSASATTALQSQINAAISTGLQPVLDPGSEYAPSWIFTVGGGTQFIDQFGDVFSGSASSGNDVANAVTDMAVRAQLGLYITYLGSHLTGVTAVRVGGLAYGELRYPSGQSGSQANAYWFYDASSQATLPSPVQGWKPGTGTVAQATAFLTAYNAAMVSYGLWIEQNTASAFPSQTKLEIMLPGWGERPGQVASADSGLLVNTPDQVNMGLDWTDLLSQVADSSRIVAYSTYADATQGGSSNPDPAAYIHSILPAGMGEAGESTGNGQTTAAGLALMFQDARTWGWYSTTWNFTGQPQTPADVDSAWLSG